MRSRGEFDDVRTSGSFDSFSSGDRDEPAAIADEIEQTRASMSGTIEAIQDRLAPERISDAAMDVTEQAKTAALEVAEYAIQEVKTAVRELADHMASEQIAGQARGAALDVTEQAKAAALEVTERAIHDAKAAVREMGIQAKGAVREATVGRVERMVSSTGESAKGIRANVASAIKENPIPAALAGLSIGWILLNRPSTPSTGSTSYNTVARDRYGSGYGYSSGYSGQPQTGQSGSTVGQAAGQVQNAAGQVAGQVQNAAGQVQSAAGQVVDQVQDTAGQVVDQVQHQAQQARGRLQQMMAENPMQVGALAAVLGGALGLAVPKTQGEGQLMGAARDRLVEQVQETVQETVQDTAQKVQSVAAEAGDAMAKEAKYQGLTPES